MRYFRAITIIAFYLAIAAVSFGQQPAPVQYAYVWQPVAVSGNYYAVPRYTCVGNWLFGPRVVFIPQPQQPAYPGPVAPYQPPQQLAPPQR